VSTDLDQTSSETKINYSSPYFTGCSNNDDDDDDDDDDDTDNEKY